MRNSEKTISANSKGIVITYGDVNKHMYTSYGNSYVKKVQLEGTSKYQNVQTHSLTPIQKELYFKMNKERPRFNPNIKRFEYVPL
jgi:hypothetical protein